MYMNIHILCDFIVLNTLPYCICVNAYVHVCMYAPNHYYICIEYCKQIQVLYGNSPIHLLCENPYRNSSADNYNSVSV